MPVSASRYCAPRASKCLYAVVSSRGVNVSRALGSTTTLIALPSPLIALPSLTTPQVHRVRRRAGSLHSGPSWFSCLLPCLAPQQPCLMWLLRACDCDVVPREAREVKRIREARERDGSSQEPLCPVPVRAGRLRLEVRSRRHG